MTTAERFSPTDPLSGLFRGRAKVTLGGVPDGLEGRILGAPRGERGHGPLRRARRAPAGAGGDGARLLRAVGSDADVPGLGQPSLRPRLAERGGLRGADERAARAAAAAAGPRVVFTTANAIVQRVPDRESVAARVLAAQPPAASSPMDRLARWLETNGFDRTATVREVGEYAVRGGIVDLWAPGTPAPIRLDFFGDTLETIRPFDPATPAHDRPAPSASISCRRAR